MEMLIAMFNGFTMMVLTTLPRSFFVTCIALTVRAVHGNSTL